MLYRVDIKSPRGDWAKAASMEFLEGDTDNPSLLVSETADVLGIQDASVLYPVRTLGAKIWLGDNVRLTPIGESVPADEYL